MAWRNAQRLSRAHPAPPRYANDNPIPVFADLEDNEPPFDAPDCADDPLDAATFEDEAPCEGELTLAGLPADVVAEPTPAPPFDPLEIDEDAFTLTAVADDDAPFDPPDENDDLFAAQRFDTPAPPQPEAEALPEPGPDPLVLIRAEPKPFAAPPRPRGERQQPVPSITIHASWDRPEAGALLAGLAADPRMARAEISVERGGLDGAVVRFASQEAPNLLIIDTTLRRAQLLAGLDRLAPVIAQGAKIVILGAVNDISLLRDLEARGVSEYLVAPHRPDDLIRIACGLYAESVTSRVIAVIGARGGVGASTVAHNLAWSIAERQDARVTLVDLDLSFGTAALDFHQDPPQSIADMLQAEDADDALLDQVTTQQTQRLRMLTAPANLEHAFELDPHTVQRVIERVRRASPHVVLDLPHTWNSWVKQTLLAADDVVIVATPDLSSLRNAKNILDLLKAARPADSPPLVALSMVGVPKRPEITSKDFAEALGAEPVASFAFDPTLFGLAELNGKMIGEAAPRSKTALALDTLAATITGRAPTARAVSKLQASTLMLENAAPLPADSAFKLVLTKEGAESIKHDYLAKARQAAQAELDALPEARRKSGVWGRIMGAAAGAAATLILGGAWVWQNQTDIAQAAEPQAHAPIAAPARQDAAALAAQYQAAQRALTEGRADEGATLMRAAAEAGHALAQHRLAKLYERGEGVPANPTLARQWTERAAAAGAPRAMHDLGAYYAQGEGAARDDAAAFRWFRQAAEFGIADSQYNLGILYQEGRGVTANAEEALFWFSVAAAQGDAEAAARAHAFAAHLNPLQAEQARTRAQAFTPRESNG